MDLPTKQLYAPRWGPGNCPVNRGNALFLQPFERRAGLAALTLAAGDERYRWVNRVFAMLEADIVPYAAPELWRIRAFECVNDLIQAQA